MNSLGAIITIIFVVAWVVQGIIRVMNSDEGGKDSASKTSDADLEQRIANRRAERARQARPDRDVQIGMDQRSQLMDGRLSEVRGRDASQMSMAERIELARERARQQAGVVDQRDDAGEALERAREQAQREAQAQRDRAAMEQQAAREAAERRKSDQERQRRALARKQAEEREAREAQQRRRRTRAQRRAAQSKKSVPLADTPRRNQTSRTAQRGSKSSAPSPLGDGPTVATLKSSRGPSATRIGPLNVRTLRKAFVMKELLDKPVALRDEPDHLLS